MQTEQAQFLPKSLERGGIPLEHGDIQQFVFIEA